MANESQYKVVCSGTLYSQTINNVFWVRQIGGGEVSYAPAIAFWFRNFFWEAVEPFLSINYVLNRIDVFNWEIATDIAANTTPMPGAVAGAGLPSYVSFSAQFNREGTGFNYPAKRFAGVPEASTDGNSLTGTIAEDFRAAINAVIAPPIDLGDGVVGQLYAVSPTPKFGVRVGPNDPVGTRVQFYTTCEVVKLGTQNSRKP